MCEQCKKELDKKPASNLDEASQSFASSHRKTTQYSNYSQNNNSGDKDIILPVDYYAKTFFDTVK
jgi:hypothetical protein